MNYDYLSTIGDHYWQWLTSDFVSKGADSYWLLLRALHQHPWYTMEPKDFYMEEEALSIRAMYNKKMIISNDHPSCLEFLYWYGMKMEAMISEASYREWFWIFIENLDLDRFTDENFFKYGGYGAVNKILARWLTRSYSNSKGNIFELSRTSKMQANKLPLMDQAYAYIRECYMLSN